jgi:hypothetical protein
MKATLLYLPIRVTALSLCLMSLHAFAQESARQSLAGEAPKNNATTETAKLFPYCPMSAWQGRRFIFLPCPKGVEQGTYDDFTGARKRKDYAGRVARVVSVNDFGGRVHLEFELEDNGEHLRARTLPNKESIKGLLLADDLEKSRQQWLGKMLWCQQLVLATYDEKTDSVGSLSVKKYAPLKVVEVNPGWDEEKPLRFVLESASGQRGFIDINLSGTNVQREMRHLSRFEEYFLTADPRQQYKWSASIWNAIENNRVVSGMTTEQVRMSWGEPEKTARTLAGEQWTYTAGVLTFKNGVLVNMQ